MSLRLYHMPSLVACLMMGSAVHAAVVYQDSFTVDTTAADTSRDPGDVLNGTTTEVGSGTWATNTNTPAFTFGQVGATTDGFVRMDGTPSNSFAMLPLTLGATDTVTLEARIKPFNSGTGDNWVAIGFNTTSGVFTGSGTGRVWMLMRENAAAANGMVVLGANGGTSAANQMVSTSIPGSPDADGYHVVVLTYDKGLNAASLTVNGQAVTLDLTKLGTPNFTHVGFQFLATDGGAAIDDFKVTAVPEPGTLLLGGLGGLLLLARRRMA